MSTPATKILLVEDNPADARLVFEYLKDANAAYEIDHVETIALAKDRLQSPTIYAVILLDLSLPDSQGLETIQSIQETAGLTPIVVMTGLGDEDVGLEAVSLGAQDFLVKGDVDTAKLARSIRFAIKRNARLTHQVEQLIATDNELPRTFGPYKLLRKVGSGGMANIFLAEETLDDNSIRQCVVKKLRTEMEEEKELRTLFLDEGKIGSLLNHPNIVSQFSHGEISNSPFICLEFIPGISLNTCIQNRSSTNPIEPEVFGNIAVQLARGLKYAHELKDPSGNALRLVHRDITPENIILTDEGVIKLVDFGIARFEGRDVKTRASIPKGKLPYMAPEQLRFEAFNHRADIYAFGIVLTELLSGRPLFPQGVLTVADHENIIRIRCRQGMVHERLQELLLSLTKLDPAERPAGMSLVLETLEEIFPMWESANRDFSLSGFLEESHSTSDILVSPLAEGLYGTGDSLTGSYPDTSISLAIRFSSSEIDAIEGVPKPEIAVRPESFHGRPFGHYDILAELGRGGMATVELAMESLSGGHKRYVAIKTLSKASISSEEQRQLFMEEARIGSLMKHPNIIHMYDFGLVNETSYIAMEFINGLNLRDLLALSRGRALPPYVCVDIASDLCRALSYAHGLTDSKAELLHLIHRDLTPENIMISRTGNVKISDFGIAQFEGREIETAFGTLRGKSAYLSPEQAFFQEIDHRVDLYNLGLVIGEMLTGAMLTPNGAIDAKDIPEVLRRRTSERIDIPSELLELILQLTAYNVADRPPTAAICAQRLNRIREEEGTNRDTKDFIFRLTEKHIPDINTIDARQYVSNVQSAIQLKTSSEL